METVLSIIVPCRNEEALISGTLDALLDAIAALVGSSPSSLDLAATPVELLVVDNDSTDGTAAALAPYASRHGVCVLRCSRRGAPCARNVGAQGARGRVLVFVDADTLVPPDALTRVLAWCDGDGREAGIVRLASREAGASARCWWLFWEHVRRLPLARAKAMPAFMFCTSAVFAELGPFDELAAVGEEWPILAGLYRARPHRLVYDRTLTAFTSSRRMELQPWGYLRTLAKYAWAIAHSSGRGGYGYGDHLRRASARPILSGREVEPGGP